MPNLKVSPSSVLLTTGQAITFSATDAADQPLAVSWSLNPPLGSLVTALVGAVGAPTGRTPSATYVAPPVLQGAPTVALIVSTDTDSGSATISLTPDPISIVPASVELKANDVQQFIAIVASAPDPGDQIDWLVSPPVGEINKQSGLYTAPHDIHEATTLTVIATNPRLGSRAGATVNLASAPWRGMGVALLGGYLFVVFCLVFLMIALWPLQAQNPEIAKTNRIEAESKLAQKINELQSAANSGLGSSSTPPNKPVAPLAAGAGKPAPSATSPTDQTKTEAGILLLRQLEQSVDEARGDLEKRKWEEAEANSPIVRTIASCINNAIIDAEGFNPYAQTEGERRSS